MKEGSVLRLFTFRAIRPAFDEILRHQLVPDLTRQVGVIDCYSGRQGPAEIGPRIVASVWASEEQMIRAMGHELGQGPFHPEWLEETTDHVLEVLPIRVATGAQGSDREAPMILRVLRGTVVPGGLGQYVTDVQAGVEADAAAGVGPVALYLAVTGPDAFITLSAWRTWNDVEQATGGDVRRPRATRHPEHLVVWDVTHFEIVQSAWPTSAPKDMGAGRRSAPIG